MSNDNFTVSGHALERFEERFPELWTDEQEIAALIHRECEEAFLAGRKANYVPREFVGDRFAAPTSVYAGTVLWEPTRTRAYVIEDSTVWGMVVSTVIRAIDRPYETNGRQRRLPRSTSITARPVWARHLLRARRNINEMEPPTEEEKRDAILVLADPANEAYYGLWDEAHQIFLEASDPPD